MKKVSVIIPCYNAQKWLPKCFLSLVKQTIGMESLELIFVDDASKDDGMTWTMLQEFERAYPESITAIHLDENLRQGGARNVALKYASGEYVAFVDADDFVADVFLEEAYNRAKNENADILQFGFYYYTERLGAVSVGEDQNEEIIYIHNMKERKKFLLSEKITYGCWNKLYRRELIDKAKVQYAEHVIYEEPLFVYPLLYYANTIVIVKDRFYFYRQNESGTMRHDMNEFSTLKMHADVQLAVWLFMKKTVFFEEYYEEIKMYFLHTYLFETLYFAKKRSFTVSLEQFRVLINVVCNEVPDYAESCYAALIPVQMELYQLIEKGMTQKVLEEYMEKL